MSCRQIVLFTALSHCGATYIVIEGITFTKFYISDCCWSNNEVLLEIAQTTLNTQDFENIWKLMDSVINEYFCLDHNCKA